MPPAATSSHGSRAARLSVLDALIAKTRAAYDDLGYHRRRTPQVSLLGFPYHPRNEKTDSVAAITAYNAPALSSKDGVRICFYVRDIIDVAMRHLN